MAASTAGHVALTRDEIVRNALRIARREGLQAVSARRLAAELGVTPMALYRHVDGMEDVVASVVDAFLDEEGLPQVPEGDWRAWLAELALGLRRLLTAQPSALDLYAHRPVATPAACRRLAVSVEVLLDAGFTPEGAERAYAATHTYTLGFCVLAAARGGGRSPRSRPHPSPATGAGHDGDPGWEVAAIAGFVSEDQFHHGLGALLAGLAPVGEGTAMA